MPNGTSLNGKLSTVKEKLSTFEINFKTKMKKDNIITALGQVQTIPYDLQNEFIKVAEARNESINFNNSTIIIQSKGTGDNGYVFSSISELLIAGYGYKLYSKLKDYYDVIDLLRKQNSSLKNQDTFAKAVKEAKNEKHNKNNLIVKDINSISVKEIRENLLEFVSDYDKWGGGKTIDRETDFWISPLYKVLGFIQSRSGIHQFIPYFEDNKDLLNDTRKEIDYIINQFNYIDTNCKSPLNIGKNIIYYGSPGTGKSHAVNDFIKKNSKYDNNLNINEFRVTLHPEYSYADFVGQLLPCTDRSGNVSYKFVPGIFTIALKKAIYKPSEPVYLILEELSRANVAAVFGDLFQLLDRENGSSEYPIDNPDIANEIYGNKNHKVRIPSNMMILCTANTNDQNVYPMDTAFKRRFDWKYISTDYASKGQNFQEHNNPLIDIGDGLKVEWGKLYKGLNSFIINDLGLSEDKQIGPYFIKFESKKEEEAHMLVQDKLLQYLWEDINTTSINVHSSSASLFLDKDEIPSFASLYIRFSEKKAIFSSEFLKVLKNWSK